MPTAAAKQAEAILRDGSQFQWYVIPLMAMVVYVYAIEVEARRWRTVFAGFAFWGMDWFNEIWNGLVYHFTGRAPVWAAPGKTAFLILIGLNIEICFMFAIAGVVFSKLVLDAKEKKILGISNRLFVALTGSLFCVLVEMFLNAVGALTWDWSWWNVRAPWLIFLFGYLPFFLVAFWVHDMPNDRARAKAVGAIFAFDAVCLGIFGFALRWI
jgi:hypothetical protein